MRVGSRLVAHGAAGGGNHTNSGRRADGRSTSRGHTTPRDGVVTATFGAPLVAPCRRSDHLPRIRSVCVVGERPLDL